MSFIAINAITVPQGMGTELEKRFGARAGEVDKQPGFQGFRLLRPADDKSAYFVLTEWDSKDSFEAWTSSQAFGQGHKASSEQGPVSSGAELYLFEDVDLGAGG